MQVLLTSCSKINLGLCLLGKREDGFHELETLMHEVSLSDGLSLEVADKTDLAVDGKAWDKGLGANSILEAKRLCDEFLGHSSGEWRIELMKHIPFGSGMGGGSSNAVAMLNYIVSLWPKRFSVKDVDQIAAKLGSDTNFFIKGGTSICRGRGEQIEPLPHRLFYFNLIFPRFSCATPKVFSKVTPDFGDGLDWSELFSSILKDRTRNDLEESCCLAYPEMLRVLSRARSIWAQVSLSGSGSTLFSVHEDKQAADMVFKKLNPLKELDCRVVQAQSFFRA